MTLDKERSCMVPVFLVTIGVQLSCFVRLSGISDVRQGRQFRYLHS